MLTLLANMLVLYGAGKRMKDKVYDKLRNKPIGKVDELNMFCSTRLVLQISNANQHSSLMSEANN